MVIRLFIKGTISPAQAQTAFENLLEPPNHHLGVFIDWC